MSYASPAEQPFSEKAINKFDVYSLKGALDDEISSVSDCLCFKVEVYGQLRLQGEYLEH
jgi:hypothetical protein